jgi:5-methylcytosine-specific restriction endonuclease McrA
MEEAVSKKEHQKEYQKAYRPKYRKEHREERRAYARDYSAKVKTQYSVLKRLARQRNLEMTITLEEFIVLRASPCFYCLDPVLSKTGYGLDRKNSSIGYVLSNVVPCCRVCNQAKTNRSTEEFLSWAKRVVDNANRSITK